MTNFPLRERRSVVTQLCRNELADIDRRYGNVDRSGDIWLLYHNATHGLQVHDFGWKIARVLQSQGRIIERDVDDVRVASAFHDHDQLKGTGENERSSARKAVSEMERFADVLDQSDRHNVGSMIEGTITSLSSDGRLAQEAARMGTLEAIVADADLAVLGSKFGPVMALNLFVEQQSMNGKLVLPSTRRTLRDIQPDHEALHGFYRFQDGLLANHRYLLDVSQDLFGPGLARHREMNAELMRLNEAEAPFSAQLDVAAMYARDFGVEGRGLV